MEIRECAKQCNAIFESFTRTPNSRSFAVIDVVHHQFKRWANELGLNASPGLSAAADLSSSKSLEDLVLQLLQIVHRNLARIKDIERDTDDDHGNGSFHALLDQMEETKPVRLFSPLVESLKILESAVDSLSQLGFAVQQTSMNTLRQRVDAFEQQWQNRSPQNLMLTHVRDLLVDRAREEGHYGAALSLCAQLASSVSSRYFKLLDIRSNTATKSILSSLHQDDRMNPLLKAYPFHTGSSSRVEVGGKNSGVKIVPGSSEHLRRSPSFQQSLTIPPLSASKDILHNAVSKKQAFLVKEPATATNAAEDIRYPRPPKLEKGKREISCPYCCLHFDKDAYHDPGWWKCHVENDLNLFVCISEDCAEPPRFFAQFDEWKGHMDTNHSSHWTEEVHLPLQWCCQKGHDKQWFDDEASIEKHIQMQHPEYDEAPSLEDWKEICSTRKPRSAHECPICNSIPETLAALLRPNQLGFPPVVVNQMTPEELQGMLLQHIAEHLKQIGFMTLRYLEDESHDNLLQAREQLLSPGRRISVRDGRIIYDDTFFIRNGEASQILRPQLRSAIFDRLIFPNNHDRQEFVDKIICPPGLAAILLIIIAGGTPSMVTTFERRLLRHDPPCTYSDRDLPFSSAQANELFGEDGARFFEAQSSDDPIILIDGCFDQQYNAAQSLPYVSAEFLGKGAYGEVHKVEIERGHYTKTEGVASEVLSLARKDFEPNEHSFASFEAENHISRRFRITNPPPSISKVLCSMTIKLDNYQFPAASIFSEPAAFDLDKYFKTERNDDITLGERIHNLQQMLQISHGLKWLNHDEKKSVATSKYEEASYIHGDLKPENIFIYHDSKASPSSPSSKGAMFKIGDFGDAYLLTQSKENAGSRQPPRQLFRVSTYRAPEIQQGKIGTKNDVWSFGCILLLVLLYNHQDGGGPNAVRTFATSRAAATGNANEDVFYRAKRSMFKIRETVCNKAVTECIENMIINNEQSTHPYDNIATQILRYIQSRILVPENSRVNIHDVVKSLGRVMDKKVAAMGEGQDVTPAMYELKFTKSSERSYLRHTLSGHLFHYSPEQITFYDVDGKVHAYVKREAAGVTKWSDQVLPDSRACGASAICIVQKTATNDPVELSVRYLDPKKTPTLIRLVEGTRLNGVALSPNEEFIAVACDPRWPGRLSARVRMYRVSDSLRLGPPVPSLTTWSDESFSSSTKSTKPAKPAKSPQIGTYKDHMENGKVKDILPGGHVDLVFSKDGETLYHAHRSTNQLVVSMWKADGTFLARSIVEDKHINDPQIFVTDISPLVTARGFVAVTHERCIIQRKWTPDAGWTEKKFEAMPGLKAILLTNDNQTVVMLVTNSRDFLECYWGTMEDELQFRPLITRDRIRFIPQQDSAYLSEHANGRLGLQVASKQESCVFTYTFNVHAS